MENINLDAAMDQRLSEALESINYRLTLNAQKQLALVKFQRNQLVAINGGIFHATPQLIAFTSALISAGLETIVIVDEHSNPINIENLQEFFNRLLSKYVEISNDFFLEIDKLKKSRTTKALVGET